MHERSMTLAAETPTPTITKPDLEDVRDVKPKALRPYKVVVLDWSTEVTPSARW
jgi:hypothetical protein